MFARVALVVMLISGLLVLSGCGGDGQDYYKQQRGSASGASTLDIAGNYTVTPDTFGFNMLTIYQSGNDLTAEDNGGGSWSGNLSGIVMQESTAAGGAYQVGWQGDISLTGKNAVGDDLTLTGVVQVIGSVSGNIIQITARYENRSIGLTGQLMLTRAYGVAGGVPGTPGGDGSGRENK